MEKFEELFQVKIDPTKVMREYYSFQQQARGWVRSRIPVAVSCSTSLDGYNSIKSHTETIVSKSGERTATVVICDSRLLHGAFNGDFQ
jgi:hypothetical protein